MSASLKNSISQYLATEKLDNEEKYNCVECQTNTTALIKKRFVKLPQQLIIHLKRFSEQMSPRGTNCYFKKIKKPVEYPLEIDFDE